MIWINKENASELLLPKDRQTLEINSEEEKKKKNWKILIDFIDVNAIQAYF